MALSHTVIVLVGATVISAAVMIVLLVYLHGGQSVSRTRKDRTPGRPSKRALSLRSILGRLGSTDSGTSAVYDPYMATYEPSADFVLTKDDVTGGAFTALYRRIGSKQKLAAVGFVVASVVFLALSLPLKSIVLEIDSVISFAVAAILFLKESREKVQSRVLNAVVLSLATTIAGLSSRTGSKFLYSPEGKTVSDVTIFGSPEPSAYANGKDEFRIVPPGMGLAKLFVREAEGTPVTTDSLGFLLPSVIHEKFGLAESVEATSANGKVQVLLRKPAVYCSCKKDETRTDGVVGCTVSSFLATLYSFASQETLSLERCETDEVAQTWRVSMHPKERVG